MQTLNSLTFATCTCFVEQCRAGKETAGTNCCPAVQMSSDTNFFYRRDTTIRVPKLSDAGIASCEHLRQEAIRACSNHTLDRRRCCTRLNKVDHARVILR